MEFKEAVTAVMKYIETTPLLVNGKNVKVCVPGKKKVQVNQIQILHVSPLLSISLSFLLKYGTYRKMHKTDAYATDCIMYKCH